MQKKESNHETSNNVYHQNLTALYNGEGVSFEKQN